MLQFWMHFKMIVKKLRRNQVDKSEVFCFQGSRLNNVHNIAENQEGLEYLELERFQF